MLNIVKLMAQLSGNAILFSLALYSFEQIGFFSSKECKMIFSGTCIKSWFNYFGNKHLKLIEYMYDMHADEKQQRNGKPFIWKLIDQSLLTTIFAQVPNKNRRHCCTYRNKIVTKVEKSWLTWAICAIFQLFASCITKK